MTTEIDIKSLKGFASIAAIGAVATIVLAVGLYYLPQLRAKVGV